MLRAIFTKTGNAVWISHLDLMRVLQRAFRRGGLMLKHSQGYSPHPHLSIAMPLSVGVSSDCEIMDFELAEGETVAAEELKDRLNVSLPEGIVILDCYEEGSKVRDLKYLRAVLTLEYDAGVPQSAADRITDLFRQPSVCVTKHGKNGDTEVDVAPMLWEATAAQSDNETVLLYCTVSAQNPTLNPLLLVDAVKKYLPADSPDFAKCCRLCFYDAQLRPFR